MLLAEKIKLELENCFYDYKPQDDFFTYNPVKIIEILVRALPNNGVILKKVYLTGFGSFEDKHGTREVQEIIGTTYILGDKDLLDELEDEKKYYYEDIRKFTNKVYINSNKSLIITSNYYFDSNILPNANNLELKGTENIYCYLKDDEIKDLLYNLLEYSKMNGNHIDDIEEDKIISYIKNIKTKTLTNN